MKIKYLPLTFVVMFLILQLIANLTQIPVIIPTYILAGLIVMCFLVFCFCACSIAFGFIAIAVYNMFKT